MEWLIIAFGINAILTLFVVFQVLLNSSHVNFHSGIGYYTWGRKPFSALKFALLISGVGTLAFFFMLVFDVTPNKYTRDLNTRIQNGENVETLPYDYHKGY